jgi:putative transposase
MPINHKKRIRLKGFHYKGCYRYFITICTLNKKPILKEDPLVTWLVDALKEKSVSYGFKIWAYCFMPDHLHLLVEGTDSNSDMKRFISSYKQYTGYHYKKETQVPLWQINFYEHVLRKEEDTLNVAYYIFNNPVRKRLVDNYRQYKFLGSFEFDVM